VGEETWPKNEERVPGVLTMISDLVEATVVVHDPATGEEIVVNEILSTKDLTFKIVESNAGAAEVSVSRGATINLGNYQSARIDVSLRVPCDIKEADKAYDFACEWINGRVKREAELITGG